MIRIFVDGACQPNPGHMGKGIVIEWQGKKPTIISEYIGEGTNNIAEYTAFVDALQFIKEEDIRVCNIHSDSNLMVQQVNGKWKCNDAILIQYRDKARQRLNYLRDKGFKIELIYIPRELNLADHPAKLGAEEGKRNAKN